MKNKNTLITVLVIILIVAVYFVFFKKKTPQKKHVANTKPHKNANTDTNENTHQGVFYVVKKGDTLSKIASKYSISLTTILKNNPQIKDANLIYPGQKIKIS
jgi:spore coat assembly protein SafA